MSKIKFNKLPLIYPISDILVGVIINSQPNFVNLGNYVDLVKKVDYCELVSWNNVDKSQVFEYFYESHINIDVRW